MNKPRLFAFYLPQFHPILENNLWWGKGFTEWTNVGKAKPLFKGHKQPHIPADLGYYDLRVDETREAQAKLAKKYGIEGFIYWHYWFGKGKRLLERPFNEVLISGKPDFPFALAWANESWKGFPHGLKNRNVLIEQFYPGEEDYIEHFYHILPALKDKRYIKVEGKPIFMIYKPLATDEIKLFIKTWQHLAVKEGLPGIHFIAHANELNENFNQIYGLGFDAINPVRLRYFFQYKRSFWNKLRDRIRQHVLKEPIRYKYSKCSKYFVDLDIDSDLRVYPSVISGWDHTPRSGKNGLVLTDYSPESFGEHVKQVASVVKNKDAERNIIFIKSWNEWAEGNYLEPNLEYGEKYLEYLYKNINIEL